MTQRPDDEMVGWSVDHLTDMSDMGHWTSQHLTAGLAKYVSRVGRGLGEGRGIWHNLYPHPTRAARRPLPEGEAKSAAAQLKARRRDIAVPTQAFFHRQRNFYPFLPFHRLTNA
jgi:hypothetical protein